MTLALGRLGWTPGAFWAATSQELLAALEGWTALHAPRGHRRGLSDEGIDTL